MLITETSLLRLKALQNAGKPLPEIHYAGARMFTVTGLNGESPKEIGEEVAQHAIMTRRGNDE